jgi:hypothetical protein
MRLIAANSGEHIDMDIIRTSSGGAKVRQSKVRNTAGLTEAQEAFARLIAWHPDWTITDCYLAAYPNCHGARDNVAKAASAVWRKPEVRSRVEALRDAFSAKCPLTRGEAMTILGDIARDPTEASRLRIDAIKQLQSMIPAWQGEPVAEVPQSITVQIVTGDGANGLSGGAPDGLTIDVDAVPIDDAG